MLEQVTELFISRGVLDHLPSDNRSDFTATGRPWDHGYVVSFNGKLRDKLLNDEVLDTLLEAKVLIERWRHQYNTKRPHSTLGNPPPAHEAFSPLQPSSGASPLRPAALEINRGKLR